jgi:lipid II:glycine glycyltransferase (peptidoglycan interpeptide bridge formation enzyme)
VLLRAWDDLVDRTPGTDVTQLSAWGRLRRSSGFSPLHLLAASDGELVGGAQILVRRLPMVGSVGYLAYGPLVAPEAPAAAEARAALAEGLVELGRRRLRMLFVQPPEGAEDLSATLLERGFRPSTAGIAPAGSVRIDLTADLETIRSGFGKRLRSWAAGRWERQGVTVRLGDERDLPLLCRLMAASAAAQGHKALPPHYVEALYSELAPSERAVLFIGEVHGVPVAADLMTRCGGMLRGRLNGFDRTDEAARLSVPAAVRWHMIGWGKAHGHRWFDFGGLRPETLAILMSGGERPAQGWLPVDQPKLTFGGTAFRYPQAVEMIASPVVRAGYDLTRSTPAGRRVLDAARTLLRGSRAGSRAPAPSGGGS